MRSSSLLLVLFVAACAERPQPPAALPPSVASVGASISASSGAPPPSATPPPQPAETGAPTDVVQLVTGRHQACALLRDGGLFCWGNNSYGQLGDTRRAPRLHPGLLAEHVTTVATSARLTCAAVSGALTCFGGQAKAIGTVAGVVSLVMNDTIGCAVTSSGELYCFSTTFGGDAKVPRAATLIEGIHGALDVALGGGLVCARTASDVRCFVPGNPAEPLADVSDVIEIASVYYGVCTLDRKGASRCVPGPLAQRRGGPGIAVPAALEGVAKLSASNHAYWPRGADGAPMVAEKLPASLGQVLDVAHGTEGSGLVCVIDRAHQASCWGEREDGMLGDGGTKMEPTPVRMAAMTDVLHLGDGNTLCPVRKGGTVACLFGGVSTPPKVSGVRQISRTCIRSSDARVKCWGYADQSLLGHVGPHEKVWERSSEGQELKAIPGLPTAIDLSVQDNFGCATAPDGRAWCWGSNGMGELGRGRKSDSAAAAPVPGIALAAEVRTGDTHSCARLRDGSLRCWGDIFADEKLTPVPMPGFPRAVSVAVGSQHVCIATTDGRVFCQGGGEGSGTKSGEFHVPMEIPGPKDVVRVFADGDYACALEKQGRVLCWGDNEDGQLGDGTFLGRETAAPVLGVDSAREVSVERDRACALLADGSVRCWGKNEYDELGTGNGKRATEPVPVVFKR